MSGSEWNNEENRLTVRSTYPENRPSEAVKLFRPFRKGTTVFAFILLICAMCAAIFAATEIGQKWLRSGWNAMGQPSSDTPTLNEEETSAKPQKEADPPTYENDIASSELEKETFAAKIENRSIVPDESIPSVVSSVPETEKGNAVLILHSHSSEAYSGDGGIGYYSENAERTVLSVGTVLSETLKEKGIASIHCEAMHDSPTLIGSYDRAAESIRFFRRQYSDLDLVVDLHRSTEPESTGSVRVIVGTADSTDTSVAENLSIAVALSESLEASGVSVLPIRLVGADLNQNLSPHAITVEIGSVFDTSETAKTIAKQVANAMADVLTK